MSRPVPVAPHPAKWTLVRGGLRPALVALLVLAGSAATAGSKVTAEEAGAPSVAEASPHSLDEFMGLAQRKIGENFGLSSRPLYRHFDRRVIHRRE